jgi:hypothetical protein
MYYQHFYFLKFFTKLRVVEISNFFCKHIYVHIYFCRLTPLSFQTRFFFTRYLYIPPVYQRCAYYQAFYFQSYVLLNFVHFYKIAFYFLLYFHLIMCCWTWVNICKISHIIMHMLLPSNSSYRFTRWKFLFFILQYICTFKKGTHIIRILFPLIFLTRLYIQKKIFY